MRMPGVSQHRFSEVPAANIPRSSFDRSHAHKTTFDSGYLVPVFVDEALPGDTFSVSMTAFARMATPLHPIMDNLFMNSFFFAVPLRLIWENFQRFMGEQPNPGDSTDFLVPQVTAPSGGWGELSLGDYFGIPTKIDPLLVNALHFRAYNLIYNEWFRDQNLQNSLTVPTDDGPDSPSIYNIVRRGKRHDYFTSGLPWPQKGPAVELPLGTTAPVIGRDGAGLSQPKLTAASVGSGGSFGIFATGPADPAPLAVGAPSTQSTAIMAWSDPALVADLSTATAATINQLRQAFQIQKLYERDARGGTRYIEVIKSHFGVTSPDARLQRPEYLGGGQTRVSIAPVAQTSSTDGTSPQGNLAAYATASVGGHGFTKSFVEHCVVIGLVAVRADLTYQQGLNRMWSRQTRWDYYWPALAHIGEQTVLNKEIYAQGTSADDEVFAYQERFAEYRYKPSLVTGLMRSNATQSLATWHLSQNFGSLPVLNASFMEDNPPVDRVVAVPEEPQFLFDAWFNYRAVRPMPVFGVPGFIDHF